MIQIEVKEDLESAIRELRRKIMKSNLFTEFKLHTYAMSKSERRRAKNFLAKMKAKRKRD